nr:uncharacterized protein LOC127347543 [Lolium perenne]
MDLITEKNSFFPTRPTRALTTCSTPGPPCRTPPGLPAAAAADQVRPPPRLPLLPLPPHARSPRAASARVTIAAPRLCEHLAWPAARLAPSPHERAQQQARPTPAGRAPRIRPRPPAQHSTAKATTARALHASEPHASALAARLLPLTQLDPLQQEQPALISCKSWSTCPGRSSLSAPSSASSAAQRRRHCSLRPRTPAAGPHILAVRAAAAACRVSSRSPSFRPRAPSPPILAAARRSLPPGPHHARPAPSPRVPRLLRPPPAQLAATVAKAAAARVIRFPAQLRLNQAAPFPRTRPALGPANTTATARIAPSCSRPPLANQLACSRPPVHRSRCTPSISSTGSSKSTPNPVETGLKPGGTPATRSKPELGPVPTGTIQGLCPIFVQF